MAEYCDSIYSEPKRVLYQEIVDTDRLIRELENNCTITPLLETYISNAKAHAAMCRQILKETIVVV